MENSRPPPSADSVLGVDEAVVLSATSGEVVAPASGTDAGDSHWDEASAQDQDVTSTTDAGNTDSAKSDPGFLVDNSASPSMTAQSVSDDAGATDSGTGSASVTTLTFDKNGVATATGTPLYNQSRYYKFNLTREGYVDTELVVNNATAAGFRLYLLDADNHSLIERTYSSSQKNIVALPRLGLGVGDYYLQVSYVANEKSTFILSVSFTATDAWEHESYCKADSASDKKKIISTNRTYYGTVTSSGMGAYLPNSDTAAESLNHDDYYQFTLSKPGPVSLTITRTKVPLNNRRKDLHFSIVDANGKDVIPYGEWGNTTVMSESSSVMAISQGRCYSNNYAKNAYTTIPLRLSAGTFYVYVRGQCDYDEGPDGDNPYSIKVNYTPSDTWSIKDYQTGTSNTPIQEGVEYSSTLISSDYYFPDKDVYKIRISTPGTWRLTAKNLKKVFNDEAIFTVLYVENAKNVKSVKYLRSTDDSATLTWTVDKASLGDYEIEATQSFSYNLAPDATAHGPYTIQVDHIQSTPNTPVVETQQMYRLYNPNSGEHFYTASASERDGVVRAGWRYEGVGWTAPVKSGTPVYRLYSGTDHHYTMDASERDQLVKVGWRYEGIGWYSDDAKGVPLYRQFNPNVQPTAPRNNSGSHNYTTSRQENDSLVRVGWRAEGIGWYGVNPSSKNIRIQSSDPAIDETPKSTSTAASALAMSTSLSATSAGQDTRDATLRTQAIPLGETDGIIAGLEAETVAAPTAPNVPVAPAGKPSADRQMAGITESASAGTAKDAVASLGDSSASAPVALPEEKAQPIIVEDEKRDADSDC